MSPRKGKTLKHRIKIQENEIGLPTYKTTKFICEAYTETFCRKKRGNISTFKYTSQMFIAMNFSSSALIYLQNYSHTIKYIHYQGRETE